MMRNAGRRRLALAHWHQYQKIGTKKTDRASYKSCTATAEEQKNKTDSRRKKLMFILIYFSIYVYVDG
jgi:hypothetical protein